MGSSTRAVVWTSCHILSKPRHHNLWIWDSQPWMIWMKAVDSVPPLLESEGLRTVSIGAHIIMFLLLLQQLEWVNKILTTTITIKLVFKFGKIIRNLSPNCFEEATTFGLDSYWYKHIKRKNITFGLDSYCYKNTRPQTTNTSNIILKTQIKIRKRVNNRGSGVRPINR